ncbi:MAG: hypothetical protein PF501_16830 [Salinisphaera sp.]|nr:hypothetical protein [Salinisphaera sp.]
MDVTTLFVCRPDVLRHVFNVDRLTREDAAFLAAVQNKHDFHAMDASHRPWRSLDVFQAEMLDGLEFIARDFDLPPVLVF